ncbi:hypothetical protein VNO77_16248 [Canavalia gladiata]|uniref:Aminotransferase-like plant mobile domain-containing protein n=1 Tax=Canavalia gladiata TaxID=3824 RepID=A0AAN9M041_CANGL
MLNCSTPCVAQLQFVHSDTSLIETLVERWRSETYTFHTLLGECTISLQDVGVLMGLPIYGLPVIGSTSSTMWQLIAQDVLGVSLAERELVGGSLKMS